MIVVLAILSLLLLISIPVFQENVREVEFHYFLEELEKDLYYYQMYSMVNNRTVRFIFVPGGSSYRVRQGMTVIHEREFPSGVTFIPRSLLLNDLRFLSSGNVYKAGRIEILFNGQRYMLVFQLVRGRFYIEKL